MEDPEVYDPLSINLYSELFTGATLTYTTSKVTMSSLSLQAYLTQSRIETDLLDAFESLGVEETNDMIDIELSDIETIITSKNLKKVEATRLRKCYLAIKKTDTSTANETKGETKGETKESRVLNASEKQFWIQKEKLEREKPHSGTYLDRSYGDHKGKRERSSYGSHSGEWKTRWTKSNSWTCCEGKDKKDLSCSKNPIYNWSCCCRSDAKNNNKCQENPLGMKWTCCGDQDKKNSVCGLYSLSTQIGIDVNQIIVVVPGLNSLSKALVEAKRKGKNCLFLKNGEHTIEIYKKKNWQGKITDDDTNILVIDFPITIIGESKDGCTIIGGLKMEGKKEDDVNVKHLTISQSKEYGVHGERGMSFHLFHLNIEKSEGCGVVVQDTKMNTMSNCQVSHSRGSGISVYRGLITMNGSGTSIHYNVTGGNYYGKNSGLRTNYSSSSIHLVSPLTKKNISINNGGGKNYGGDGTIKTLTELEMIEKEKHEKIRLATKEKHEKIRLATKAAKEKREKEAKEKLAREKPHSGTYLDRSYGGHQGRWEPWWDNGKQEGQNHYSYGSHSGEWKTRWTSSNSWTCCEGKDKKDLSCSENPICKWSCCGSDAKNNNICQKNPLGMKWSCCGDQDQTNLVCRLYSQMDRFKASGYDCAVTQNGLVLVCPEGALRVKPGSNSLKNALIKAKENGIKEIFLEDGVHTIETEKVAGYYEGPVNILVIDFPITIMGESKDGCTIIGGLKMEGKKEDDVNVKHLTISQSKEYGVHGERGMSFHLFHLNIEKSEGCGVVVQDTKMNTMSNCQVSHSRGSGISVYRGLITMNGSGTSIHYNVTGGSSSRYGLNANNSDYSDGSIRLVSPLTKESVSINNGGGGNYGGDGTIETIYGRGFFLRDRIL